MTEAQKRRELLPLIHHHLVQAGYVRAAREVKLQSAQKTFPAPSVTLLDIYTHWQQTSEVAKKRKAEEADGEIPCKVRVSDPTSSSESSEEEKEQQERGEKTVKTTKVLSSNSVSVIKGMQCKNSLSEPKENVKTKNKKGTIKTVVTSASHPDPLEAQTTSGKPGPTVSVQSPSKKSPAAPRKQAAQSSSNSLATHSEEKVASPVVPRPAPVPPDKKTESSSEDSSTDETDIEMEKAVGTPQGKSALVRGDSAASVPTKGSQKKMITPSPGRLVTEPLTAKEKRPEETSESSDESESDEDVPTPQGQTQVKTLHLGEVPGRVGKTTPNTGKTVTPSSRPNLGLPSKAEESSESSEESESEEEDTEPQRHQVKTTPASGIKVSPWQGALPVPGKSVTSNLQVKAAEPRSQETSSESSDEDVSAPQGQGKSSTKTPQANAMSGNRAPAPSNITKVPLGKGALQAKIGPSARTPEFSFPETSSDSSEESESEEDIIVPQRQEKLSEKTPQANATPVKGTLLAVGKPMTSAPQARTGPSAPQAKPGPSAPPARTGPSAMVSEPGSSETSSESSEESDSEEEIKAPQEKGKSAMKVSQINAITTKVAPAPTQRPLGKEALSAPGKSGTVASEVKAQSAAETLGSESSESSEESESEEETPTLQTQVNPPGKTLTKAIPAPPTKSPLEKGALHTPGGTVSAPASARVTPAAKGVRPGGSEESAESSEESESEVETPVSQGQAISVKNLQVKTSPASATKGPLGKGVLPAPGKLVTAASNAKGTSLTKAVGPGKPEESSESSEETDSEVEVPLSQGQAKLAAKAPQINTSLQKSATVIPISSKGIQGRVSAPAPWKSGPAPLQAKVAGPGKPKATSESSEESESEEESPASRGQAKPTVKAPQVDAPPGKGAPVTPVSAKGTRGKVSAPAPWKSGPAPLQAKAAGPGRPKATSESSEESESEEESPASRGQAKPTVKAPQVDAPPGKGAPVTPVSAKGTRGKVSAPAPWKSGPAPLQAKAAGPGRPKATSESSEESESEEESPASRGQAKPVVKPGQADTPSGKGTSISPVSLKGSQGKAPTPSPLKSGNAPLQTKEEVQVKAACLGKAEETSEEDSEWEDSISVSQGQVKPAIAVSPGLEGGKGTTISSPKKSAVASLQAIKVDSSSSDDSSSSSDDTLIPASQRQVKPSVPAPQGKAAEKPAVPLTTVEETSSSESMEDTESEEEEVPTPQGQVKTAVKNTHVNPASGRESKDTPASGKSVSSSKTTITGPIKPEEHSESSEESESEDEVKPSVKTPQVTAASIRKKEPTPALGKSVAPSPQTQVGPQAKVIGTAVSEESSDTSDESESEGVIPVSQEQVSSGKTDEKAAAAKNSVGKVSAASSDKQLASPGATRSQKSKSSNGEPPAAQTTCVMKSKTAKQDKKSKLAGGTQATPAQDSFSVTTSNGTKSEKEDSDIVKAKQTQNLGPSPKGKATVNTESPEDSSEEEMIEPSQSVLSGYAFPSSSLPVSINPQLQKAPPKQRLAAIASAGPALPVSYKGSPQSDSSDSEVECKTESEEQPPQTGKKLKTSVSRHQSIGKGFKSGAVDCKPASPKHGISCQSPVKSMDPSNLPSLIRLQISSADENSELNNASLNSKASGIRMLSDLLKLEKKNKSTESSKSGKGSKKSKSKRKLTEDSPVAKAPKSKKKKLMSEVPKEGETLQEKTIGTTKVGKKEKASGDAKEKKPKGVHSSKKNKEKPQGNITVTVGESGKTLGPKTKKEKKQKKKSDKKKKSKDKKDKKKKKQSISKNPDPASVSLKKEKKKKKKVKQID
ncbi:treacle protein isoform X2 [Phascolarctos cinereus]|uniref:Treacle protein isoform X1 n=1 Tax=Phascolarctos cinereus TaxID=38626 RepID=A0A6P5ICG1_PHACI|nr:treacle protein isoform X1 [Phascolarctos cinereus]